MQGNVCEGRGLGKRESHADKRPYLTGLMHACVCVSVCVCVSLCTHVYLQLPEDAACVSVVVVSERDVLHTTAVVLQVAFHVFEEPGLKVQPYPVDLMADRQSDRLKVSMTGHIQTI